MTQLLLFDAYSVPSPVASGLSSVASGLQGQQSSDVARPVAAQSSRADAGNGSIPLYDPRQGELHRMGDLARLVLARYDLVAQRRAAMRARG